MNNQQKTSGLLKIGELAKATNETKPTIRFWTSEGLLDVSDKTKGGYALYSPTMIARVKRIRQLQENKRLFIKEIKEALA